MSEVVDLVSSGDEEEEEDVVMQGPPVAISRSANHSARIASLEARIGRDAVARYLSQRDSDDSIDSGISISQISPDYSQVDDFNLYRIEIRGEPKSMPRPTFMAWLQNGNLRRRVTNPAKSNIEAFRSSFKQVLQGKYSKKKFPIYERAAVVISIGFYLRFPNNVFQKNKRSNGFKVGRPTRNGRWPITKVPDIDNLAKFVLDALTGIVYTDDKQVCCLCLFKVGDSSPPYDGRTIVRFYQFPLVDDVDPPHVGPEHFLNDDMISLRL